MSQQKMTAAEAFTMAQQILNRTAKLINEGRQMRPPHRIVVKDDLYTCMDQYWKYYSYALALQEQEKSKL